MMYLHTIQMSFEHDSPEPLSMGEMRPDWVPSDDWTWAYAGRPKPIWQPVAVGQVRRDPRDRLRRFIWRVIYVEQDTDFPTAWCVMCNDDGSGATGAPKPHPLVDVERWEFLAT